MDRRKFLCTSLASLTIASATGAVRANETIQQDTLNPHGIRIAGIRMIPVVGGKYKVWTKKIGESPLKVLLLHGGPGLSHEYLEAMESFLPAGGVEMYYYDQLGCNNSDCPDDESLWNLPRYLDEVEEVRRGLGLDHFVLFGHSWGGTLAIEYALRYPQYLRGLVISNMAAGMNSYLQRTAALKLRLNPDILARLKELELAEAYDSSEYQKIMMNVVYPQMICRLSPWPEPVERTFRHVNEKIYNQMQGKSEYLVTGNLKGWDSWDRLNEITTKTLTIGSEHDEMDPADLRKMAGLLPNGQFAFCPKGSHLCMWDDQAIYFKHLLKFLHTV